VHWGSNWGFDVPAEIKSAARLWTQGADIVHGHSSHHFRGVELVGSKLILYGCGDLINDYETIPADPQYFPHVRLGFSLQIDARGRLQHLDVEMFTQRLLRLERLGDKERQAVWSKLREISVGLS
jgi:poly-gamma-glutamate synthesis protein (capsule biosynthesis protein)